MIQLGTKTLISRQDRLFKKNTYGGVSDESLEVKTRKLQDVDYLMKNDQEAIELQLSNLILTYGAAAIKKELNKQTKLKKAV